MYIGRKIIGANFNPGNDLLFERVRRVYILDLVDLEG